MYNVGDISIIISSPSVFRGGTHEALVIALSVAIHPANVGKEHALLFPLAQTLISTL